MRRWGWLAVLAVVAAGWGQDPTKEKRKKLKPEERAHEMVTQGKDLRLLTLCDQEFVLANGSREDAETMFAAVKGSFPMVMDAVVVSATTNQVQAGSCYEGDRPKRADVTFNFDELPAGALEKGDRMTVAGSFDAYQAKPIMITMNHAMIRTMKKKSHLRAY